MAMPAFAAPPIEALLSSDAAVWVGVLLAVRARVGEEVDCFPVAMARVGARLCELGAIEGGSESLVFWAARWWVLELDPAGIALIEVVLTTTGLFDEVGELSTAKVDQPPALPSKPSGVMVLKMVRTTVERAPPACLLWRIRWES